MSKEGLTLSVEHAVGTGSALDFRERGHITIRSTKGIFGIYKDNDELASKEFQNLLQEAAYKGNFYHIRIALQPLENEESDVPYYLSTFIKACSLVQSNFSDIIKLNVDHTGQIFAVGLSTTTADCSDIHTKQVVHK
ncbi:Hypothetical predicted protein [Paramuricea clavata]|uniref:ER membrane protein complex subunit 10 n=1 Tax=Paramuricea clavata TaxID=317549 RepID=A0A6S7I4X6_PARCT|nr:Hypothetical predicted protein [Paramuricea clavata]